jgi:hypothetical protein
MPKLSREIEMFLSWWRVTKSALNVEAELNVRLAKVFEKVADEVIGKLGDRLVAGDPQKKLAVGPIEDVKEKVRDLIYEYTKKATQSGRLEAASETGVHLDKLSESALQLLKDHAFEAADSTIERARGNVMGALQIAYDEGMGIDEAAQLLRDNVFEGLANYESERIARTEIHSAQMGANHSVLVDASEYEMWITAEDDRVRDGSHGDADHVAMHGQIVRSGDAFSNGLMYPGDMSGDAGEWMNCRCALIAFEMPAGMAAPEGQDYFYEEDLVEVETAAEAA